jgi:tripartite-type tricarboxylate transporter receptor subunit TctC
MTTHNRRRFLKLSAAVLAAPAFAQSAFAQTAWPAAKPIRAIVPFSAGSTIDIIGRIVLDPLSRQLGQTIVVENRGGAGGSLGSAAVAKADPDGYTLLINAAAHSGAPAAYPNLPYDAAADFSAVASFGSVPNVLLVAPSKGIKTVQELVAKAKDGSMSFASAGAGSATHWAAERFIQCGIQGHARSVPRRAGGAHRGHDRPGRFCFHRYLLRSAFYPEQATGTARGQFGETVAGLARSADDARGRLQGFGLQLLERNACPGKDAARDR